MPDYKPTRRSRKVRERRSQPVLGKGEDAGRYHRCRACVFICDSNRDGLGGKLKGASLQENSLTSSDFPQRGSGDPLSAIAVLDTLTGQVAMENGADGNPKLIKRVFDPSAGTGCPFCHSGNWK